MEDRGSKNRTVQPKSERMTTLKYAIRTIFQEKLKCNNKTTFLGSNSLFFTFLWRAVKLD